MLKEIITKWLGEEKWKATQTNYENHNQSLENLKSRIPELEEMIEKEIQEQLKNSWNKSIDENLPWDLGDALVAINTLKGGNK